MENNDQLLSKISLYNQMSKRIEIAEEFEAIVKKMKELKNEHELINIELAKVWMPKQHKQTNNKCVKEQSTNIESAKVWSPNTLKTPSNKWNKEQSTNIESAKVWTPYQGSHLNNKWNKEQSTNIESARVFNPNYPKKRSIHRPNVNFAKRQNNLVWQKNGISNTLLKHKWTKSNDMSNYASSSTSSSSATPSCPSPARSCPSPTRSNSMDCSSSYSSCSSLSPYRSSSSSFLN